MIKTAEDPKYYLECDRVAMSRTGRARPWDLTYWFLHCMRHYEYWQNRRGAFKVLMELFKQEEESAA